MPSESLDLQDVLDGLGHGVLIFNGEGDLVMHNRAAGTIVGPDLKTLKDAGWTAALTLFQPRDAKPGETLDDFRKRAYESPRAVRFNILLSAEYVPCWIAALPGKKGEIFNMLVLDVADWTAITELIGRFRSEVREAVFSTRGHIDLINNSMGQLKPDDTVGQLTKRIGGFNRLIDMHMFRTEMLIEHVERLEAIRTGTVREDVREARRKIVVEDWLEDFIEEIDEESILDPETEQHDYRSRISIKATGNPVLWGSSTHIKRILRDILRNAIMYSLKATPITITVHPKGADKEFVQIDVTDQGYGVREKEAERVFTPFQRARQPQIISEFGYGLSLYLAKQEVEAMSGKMWFESTEKVGSTFSFKLPAWRDESSTSGSNT